uniref:Uncharacterized protein n=1 Tax=Globisporangium ultimum (strain ATCC 200006 / CBS 805.95 / DAOM BR144) TaxID=431595 RepID=K3WQU3_GLOUD
MRVAEASPPSLSQPREVRRSGSPLKSSLKPQSPARRVHDADEADANEEDAVFHGERNEGADDTITVLAHVKDKIIPVHCGFGTQLVVWLGHVAIARFGEDEMDDKEGNNENAMHAHGWMQLGIPTKIVKDGKHELKLTDLICDVLPNNSHVYISTSLG